MIELPQALRVLDERVAPLAPTVASLHDAIGCRLAQPIHAIINLPGADVSEMDGYAVRAADAGHDPLPVAFEIQTGTVPPHLPPRAAARIFTGAELPSGADAVVPQEEVTIEPRSPQEPHPGTGVLLPTCKPGRFVRKAGEVCRAGEELASGGAPITPQLAALLAGAGPTDIHIIPRPRLAVITTGSELVPLHQQPGPGQIRDSNGLMLAALAQRASLMVRLFERVPDERSTLRNAIVAAMERADVIVTSGGVAVGDYDLVPGILAELGGEIIFRKVAIKPGKPILVAHLGPKWFVGLPGNPLSAFVGWHLFIQPMAERLAGNADFVPVAEQARLTAAAKNPGDRLMLSCGKRLPAESTASSSGEISGSCQPPVIYGSTATAPPRVQLLPWKGSHDLLALSQADVLVQIPPRTEFPGGATVTIHRIS